MANLVKLGIALALAIAAGLGNFLWIQMRTRPAEFVAFAEDVREGDIIKENMLTSVPIQGDMMRLRQTLVPKENQAVIFGVRAPRDYRNGDVVFHQDLSSNRSRWESLGPFTLVSVGDRLRLEGSSGYSAGGSSNTVTVAVKLDDADHPDIQERFDEKTERLLDIVDRMVHGRGQDSDSGERIVAIQLYPSANKSPDRYEDVGIDDDDDLRMLRGTQEQVRRLSLEQNERAIIVPLQGVESVPEVLVRGEQIGFIIPSYR